MGCAWEAGGMGAGRAKRIRAVHSETCAVAILVPSLVVHREGDAGDGGERFCTL